MFCALWLSVRLRLMERRRGGLLAATFLVTLSVCRGWNETRRLGRSAAVVVVSLARSLLLSRHEAARPTNRALESHFEEERGEKTSGKWNMLPRMTSNKREREAKEGAAPMRHPH